MESRLRQRLDELRSEYDNGRKTLDDLEGQAANVRATLLRIAGAIQVIEEVLGESQAAGESAQPPQAFEDKL